MNVATTVDEYLAQVHSAEFVAALERFRTVIREEIPDAEEVINYGMPGFRKNRRVIVWFAAFKNHLSFFAGGGTAEFAAELNGYTSKGAVQFTPDNPLPEEWVRKVVRLRLAEQVRE